MWARLLGPTLTRREYVGYSKCAVPAPTIKALRGYKVIGISFGADWCKPCMEFKLVLKKLFSAQAAQGADRLEIVLASSCREAKATKYFGLGMPWRAMYEQQNWHEVKDDGADGKVWHHNHPGFGPPRRARASDLQRWEGMVCG